MSDTFYLHEDEWGMIELLPIENMVGRKEIAEEAAQFGAEHFDGAGWTEAYIIPEAQRLIAERHIPLAELRLLIGSWLPEAPIVQSGYSSYVETLQHSFAFGDRALRSGALYGNYEGSTITRLNVIRPVEGEGVDAARFAEALHALGERHSLMLADWWSNLIIDLRDRDAVMSYLRGDADETEDNEPKV